MAQSEDEGASKQHPLTPSAVGFGRLFERVRDAVIVADDRGRIVLWNPAAAALFGYTTEEACRHDLSIIIPQRLRERHDAGMRRFRETGTGPLIEAGAVLELPALRKDGSEIVIELTLSRLDDGYVMGIVRDITERVRLRAEIDADRRRLREANESLESFSYVVGHDLKEPVRAVDAYLEVVAEAPGSDEAREALEKARAANLRMRQLLEGLLEWSRATLVPIHLEPVDLGEVLRGPCAARYQHVLQERGARLDIQEGLPPLLATEGLLCQIFGNLILNGVRHNPSPEPQVGVLLLSEKDGVATLAVRDNGPGFPPEVKQRIARMRATRPATVRGGFGMTIAVRAAHLMGGAIELGEAPGGGGEVRVKLRTAPR
ncbi:MAG TPA: PAS domain-containing sensor histidine kinase [Candidatus Thermoplasmatota archaeon]|nr:PAS domain-containing sensor histidine kinase [Candidatus Thermoplasmatota archaeon]